tara:strand:- start:761 stop:2386 length:1626 start_codon:yes stop_codon:yes gene_type:complete
VQFISKPRLLLVFLFLLSQLSWADTDPGQDIEFLEPVPATGVDILIHPNVTYNPQTAHFTYRFRLESLPTSQQPVASFDFDINRNLDLAGPLGEPSAQELVDAIEELIEWPTEKVWSGMPSVDLPGGYNILSYGPWGLSGLLQPGESLSGFVVHSTGYPGITTSRVTGDVPPPEGQQVILGEADLSWPNNAVQKKIVGPTLPFGPSNSPTLIQQSEYLESVAAEALTLSWLDSDIISALSNVRSRLSGSQNEVAIQEILNTLNVLDQKRGESVSEEGYFLIKPALTKLLHDLGYVPPSQDTWFATKDNILSQRNDDDNDGANRFLTLEKIQGKASRSAIGFDLSGLDTSTLSQATLVLTVDPSNQVTGWGNGENVLVRPIVSDWVEGNGINFDTKKKDQVPGDGGGATWSVPQSGGSNWDGAFLQTVNSTSFSVVVTNHYSGTLEFDVTQDIVNGNGNVNGWLLLKERENKGSKISFYSKEGALLAGDENLAPKLVLSFGQQASSTETPFLHLAQEKLRTFFISILGVTPTTASQSLHRSG